MNSLGSCFGSTGPASVDPRTGQRYGLSFPGALARGRRRRGPPRARSPRHRRAPYAGRPVHGRHDGARLRGAVPRQGTPRMLLISCGPRSLPFAIALRSLQREMIRRDPAWADGNYEAGAGPIAGMRLARKLGMITYRSAEEWEQRFGRERIPEERQSGDRVRAGFRDRGLSRGPCAEVHGPVRCQLLSLPVPRQRPVRSRRARRLGDGRPEASESRERALVIGVATDFLFPVHQQRELAAGLRRRAAAR